MYLLALITAGIFGIGYWSAATRVAQLGGAGLHPGTKVFVGIMGLLCAFGAFCLITTPGLPVLFAEFFTLCFGQCVALVLCGKSKKG